mmetsp:Transcript_17426/g.21101  ORF Transcript_17426/g.21101 Transcript_17426/m.21101 type:complete len:91 (-) Transcript_17426:563-835(-)
MKSQEQDTSDIIQNYGLRIIRALPLPGRRGLAKDFRCVVLSFDFISVPSATVTRVASSEPIVFGSLSSENFSTVIFKLSKLDTTDAFAAE